MKKAFIPVFMIFIGMFSHAEVTTITLQGQTIRIVYDAKMEFNTQEFLSAIREKQNEFLRNNKGLDPYTSAYVTMEVKPPSCASPHGEDMQICVQYSQWLNDHIHTISQMFIREKELVYKKGIILAEMQIFKDDISYLSHDSKNLQIQAEKRHDFLIHLEAVVENQQKKKELTRAFERYNAEYALSTEGMNEWITNARFWAKMNNDSEVFEDFIDNIEYMYKHLNQLNSQAFSNFHLLLTDYDPDVLQNIFIFLFSFHNEVASQYQLLVKRLDNKRSQFRSLKQQLKATEKEINSIWAPVASVKRHNFNGCNKWYNLQLADWCKSRGWRGGFE